MEARYGVRLALTLLGLAALAVACAGSGGSPPSAQPPAPDKPGGREPSTGQSQPTPTLEDAPVIVPRPTTQPTTQSVAGSEAAVQAAKRELAQRTGAAASDLNVVSIMAVDWPDSSLGCPKSGMLYSQIITPGYRIVLSSSGKEYEYHSDRAGNVVFCEGR